ncbi:Uncharacterised protein [Mycobacterium tuberculosis]|nr:Uncharacterised protein [Mycobacterium tuberculosis]
MIFPSRAEIMTRVVKTYLPSGNDILRYTANVSLSWLYSTRSG